MLLMTSHTESFGIVLIEAMSCGVPCIIFDTARGACEIIEDDYNGFKIKNTLSFHILLNIKYVNMFLA